MDAATTGVPIIRAEGEGERRWWYGGGVHTWKVTGAESGCALLVFEDLMVGNKVTPWHRHPDADEMLYVLEGEILVDIDGQRRTVGVGGLALAPRGVPHAFRVTSERARLLCVVTPGTTEEFFRNASEPTDAHGDGSGPVDFGRVQESARQTGATEVLGPPPFETPSP